jgi:MoaA/NifB/PqqE/SkfB family radical SAM enzyme
MEDFSFHRNSKQVMVNALPPMICFRVTRFCNARCGFCLAPPDGGIHPPSTLLKDRIDWLFKKGIKTIHFCGGEPTIHHGLPELIAYVNESGKKSKLTTNGITVSDELIDALARSGTEVKVSLHGYKEHHDEMVGRTAFENTTASIKRLMSKGVKTSVQCTIVTGHLDIVDWNIKFCIENKIKRISFLPFIPRGNGYVQRNKYELSVVERRNLYALIKERRRRLVSRIDIRLLDFNARPIHVVESDGRVVLEGATETRDTLICKIPIASGVKNILHEQ